jgi:hypothetical protein
MGASSRLKTSGHENVRDYGNTGGTLTGHSSSVRLPDNFPNDESKGEGREPEHQPSALKVAKSEEPRTQGAVAYPNQKPAAAPGLIVHVAAARTAEGVTARPEIGFRNGSAQPLVVKK